MIRVRKILRDEHGRVAGAKITPETRRDCRRFEWAMNHAYYAPVSWVSLLHLLLAKPRRN